MVLARSSGPRGAQAAIRRVQGAAPRTSCSLWLAKRSSARKETITVRTIATNGNGADSGWLADLPNIRRVAPPLGLRGPLGLRPQPSWTFGDWIIHGPDVSNEQDCAP